MTVPAPYSYRQYAGNGAAKDFSVPFPYLEKAHVHVYLGFNLLDGTFTSELAETSGFTWTSGTVVRTVTAPATGTTLTVIRQTPNGQQLVEWVDGSNLISADLNTSDKQNLYVVQEQQDRNDGGISQSTAAINAANAAVTTANAANTTANAANALSATKVSKAGDAMTGPLAMGANKITGVGNPTAAQDAATKTYVDNFVGQTANIADGSITTAKLADSSVTTAKVADSAITSAKIADGTIATADIGNLQVTGAKIADDTITSAKLTGATVVTNSEVAGVSPNDTSFFTTSASDLRYFRQDSSETINSGMAWSGSDSYIATTAAIDARIIDLVDDVGGFVPIANENSFPATNPDINSPDGTGTVVSIATMTTSRTPSGGTVSIANGSGSNIVTITGCGTTVLAAGFGVLVETTATLHTYTFHRLTPKATEVTTVASISGNVTTVAGIAANVTTVAGISGNVTTVAGNTSNINAVVANATNINTVATNNSNVTAVGANIANVNAAATNQTNINGAVANATNINTVAGNNANVTAVGSNISNVNSVAGNATNINATVANATNINTTAGSIAAVNTTAGSIANVNTTAGSIAGVNTVATNIASVNTVAGNNTNVTTVAGISGYVTAVGTNVTAIINSSLYLNSFLGLYLGEKTSDPFLDGLGNGVTTGDFYFNSISNQVRFYNGVAWQSITENSSALTAPPNGTFSLVYTATAGTNTIDLGGLTLSGGVFPDENSPTNRMSLALGATTYNLGAL
jgi:hypothetical protein